MSDAESCDLVANEYLTFYLGDQLFGVSVLQVSDVLGPQKITTTPLAPPAVQGVMNLRGRIVTAIDVLRCLSLPPREDGAEHMSVVIEEKNELYSLIIDRVGDVLNIDASQLEAVPATLDARWRDLVTGICKLDGRLLVIIDVQRMLARVTTREAALEGARS